MKCNPDQKIIESLAKQGVGFDCASRSEIDKALDYVDPSRIIFAHPCKHPLDIAYASNNGIAYTTFDTVGEVEKLKGYPIRSLLRIKIDNPSAVVQLGRKYGADVELECTHILETARDNGILVDGVSFHVGSASSDPLVFDKAISQSALILQKMREYGFQPKVLDIGGGFGASTFDQVSHVIRNALDKHITDPNIRIIAEPGRYFAEEVCTFLTPIIGKRYRSNVWEYWITDGLYGSFNCILYDQQYPKTEYILKDKRQADGMYRSFIWGASCDSADKVTLEGDKLLLPKLEIGDWLLFNRFGAYTIAGACNFNGINMMHPRIFYVPKSKI